MRQVIGPLRFVEHETRHHEWVVCAEEVAMPNGSTKWDVYADHENGRVPIGKNLHDDPAPEVERLKKVLDMPLRDDR